MQLAELWQCHVFISHFFSPQKFMDNHTLVRFTDRIYYFAELVVKFTSQL